MLMPLLGSPDYKISCLAAQVLPLVLRYFDKVDPKSK